jgi:5-methylcytosine-specific restriction enzyme A
VAKRVKASTVCPKCPELQPCPTHGMHGGKTGYYDRNYLPTDWPRRRKLVLGRDPICVLCGKSKSTDVDHIGDRLDHSLENLRGLCRKCHRSRTSRQANAAKKRKRELRAVGIEGLSG